VKDSGCNQNDTAHCVNFNVNLVRYGSTPFHLSCIINFSSRFKLIIIPSTEDSRVNIVRLSKEERLPDVMYKYIVKRVTLPERAQNIVSLWEFY
jgi:hypothetical protein